MLIAQPYLRMHGDDVERDFAALHDPGPCQLTPEDLGRPRWACARVGRQQVLEPGEIRSGEMQRRQAFGARHAREGRHDGGDVFAGVPVVVHDFSCSRLTALRHGQKPTSAAAMDAARIDQNGFSVRSAPDAAAGPPCALAA